MKRSLVGAGRWGCNPHEFNGKFNIPVLLYSSDDYMVYIPSASLRR